MPYTSLDQFVADLPRLASRHADALKGHDTSVLFITKQGRCLHVALNGGQVTVSEGEQPAACTVTADENDLLALIGGRLSPTKAILFGKIKLKGDIGEVMTLIKLLG